MLDFEILPLTPDEGEENNYNYTAEEEEPCNWLEDSECQENLFCIVPLMPEETVIDENNHCQSHIKLFFEELGYLTEEPEPIDPTRDYDAEARQLLEEREKTRPRHVDLSRMPSLAHSRSGVSSTSSSIHHDFHNDVRSPLYMGQTGAPAVADHHAHNPAAPAAAHPYHHPHHYHNHHLAFAPYAMAGHDKFHTHTDHHHPPHHPHHNNFHNNHQSHHYRGRHPLTHA